MKKYISAPGAGLFLNYHKKDLKEPQELSFLFSGGEGGGDVLKTWEKQ